jgi:hypothetical protein
MNLSRKLLEIFLRKDSMKQLPLIDTVPCDKFEQLGMWIHQEKFTALTRSWKNFNQG